MPQATNRQSWLDYLFFYTFFLLGVIVFNLVPTRDHLFNPPVSQGFEAREGSITQAMIQA